ncbi:MAG: MBL fold metallo-hydrolase [Gammaproteobacteria bacterium]
MKNILTISAVVLLVGVISTSIVAMNAEQPKSATLAENAIKLDDTPLAGYRPTRISDHMWVVHGPLEQPNPENAGFMNNPAFMITDKSVVVIDPGGSRQVGEGLLALIRMQTDKPVTHIFNSHVHGDHWLGNHAFKKAFPSVAIYAHPEMINQAENGEAESWLTLMETLTEGKTAGTEAVIPAIELEDGQTIKIDGLSIKIHLNDWAHTKTDAMFVLEEDRVLLTGDNALFGRIARMDDGSFRGNIAVLDAALEYPIDTVVPGHGKTATKEELKLFRDYLDILYSEAARLMEEGQEAFEMKDTIGKKLAVYKDWSGFDKELGKHISLAVLEAEQADFE